jgi:putative phosphoesterase
MYQQIALISDIQGNALALRYVLRQITAASIDQIVCLGDLVTGPEPRHVIHLLREHNVSCVRGNMDEVVLNPPAYTGDEIKYAQIDAWCSTALSAADRSYLETLPLTMNVHMDGFDVLCYHGSPQSHEDVIEATTPDAELARMLDNLQARIMATGHMHLPMMRTYGETLLVNPGSVGLPFGGKRPMPTRAEYAIITAYSGAFAITFYQVNYTFNELEQTLIHSGMPHAEWYLSKWKSAP